MRIGREFWLRFESGWEAFFERKILGFSVKPLIEEELLFFRWCL